MVPNNQGTHRDTIVIDGHKITLILPSTADSEVLWKVRDTLFQNSYLARKTPKICM